MSEPEHVLGGKDGPVLVQECMGGLSLYRIVEGPVLVTGGEGGLYPWQARRGACTRDRG